MREDGVIRLSDTIAGIAGQIGTITMTMNGTDISAAANFPAGMTSLGPYTGTQNETVMTAGLTLDRGATADNFKVEAI